MISHLSEEQITACLAGERSREVEAHVQSCTSCAAELTGTKQALLLFGDSANQVAAHWQSQAPAAEPRRSVFRWAGVAAAAVSAVILAATLMHRNPEPPPAPPSPEVFVRIPYVVPPAPYERTEVVRMDVPKAALIAAGFKLDTATAGDSVAADVLVGQDGRPLAVRFQENRND